jgi:hypothetical protein
VGVPRRLVVVLQPLDLVPAAREFCEYAIPEARFQLQRAALLPPGAPVDPNVATRVNTAACACG